MTTNADRYYAAQALDAARADLREPAWSVNDDARDAAKDARDASRRGERRVGGVWVPEEDVPDWDEA